jgi:hypothetical protein
VIFIVFFLLRIFIFPEIYYLTKIIFLEDISIEFFINRDLFLGILAVISRFSLKGFIEDILQVFLSNKHPIGDEKLPFLLNQDKLPEEGSGSKDSLELRIEHRKEEILKDIYYTDGIKFPFNEFKSEMGEFADKLKNRNKIFDVFTFTGNEPEVHQFLVKELRNQNHILTAYILARIDCVRITMPILPSDVKGELNTINDNMSKLYNNHLENIEKIRNIKDERQQAKEYFDTLNAYRNKARKEVIKYEAVSHDGLKKYQPNLYKLKEFKQLVNIDAPKVIKEVVDQDDYLKKKISEIINATKK